MAKGTFFSKHCDIPLSVYSIIIFITVLLLPEGQARKAMEHTNKAISFGYYLTESYFTFFLSKTMEICEHLQKIFVVCAKPEWFSIFRPLAKVKLKVVLFI